MSPEPTKVLLVDDDPAMLRLLAKWLTAAGYCVLSAANGRKAMELIEKEEPAILLTDWEMPHMDGLELCRWVRKDRVRPYLYTIFLTVRSHAADMLKGLEAGADDFLRKPVDRDELLARMRAGSRVLELEQRLGKLANTDALTGLATRRALFDHLQREWSRVQRYNEPLSCVMIDIDYFKRINDTHGHHAGDEVIRHIGELLSRGLRVSDLVGRYGGEEFCIALPRTDEQQAAVWAERMRREMGELRIQIGSETIAVTASFGVAQRMPDTSSPEQLVDAADQALVVAKRSGRDRVVTWKSLSQSHVAAQPGDLAGILENIPAREIMTSIVAPLNQNHTAGSAAAYFLRFRIPSAPVVDPSGFLVGILSEKDLMAMMLGPRWWTTPIKDVMRRNVVCYDEQASALAIFEFLARVSIRGVVIAREGRPTGLITRGSLLRFFMNTLAARRIAGVSSEVDAAEAGLAKRLGGNHPADRIAQTVRTMAAEASDLERRLGGPTGDLVPCVVGGATRMQDMVIDLLALSRFVNIQAASVPNGPVASAKEVGSTADGKSIGVEASTTRPSPPTPRHELVDDILLPSG